MAIKIRQYVEKDLQQMVTIWNEVVDEGIAFPQEDDLTLDSGKKFFAAQSHVAVAEEEESRNILGLYILHPNNLGRCGHIANASYAVAASSRGLHVGEKLVQDCLLQGKQNGFKIL